MTSSPVKCVPSVTRTSLLVHFLGSVWYACGVYYDHYYRNDIPQFQRFGGRYQFLTQINFKVTFLASVFALCVDVIQMTTKSLQRDVEITKDGYPPNTSILIRIRDELISCWVYALCTIVPILYWGLVLVDKKSMHSAALEKQVPLFGFWNHYVHSFPLLYVFVLITWVNYDNVSTRRMLFNCWALICTYLSWLWYCAQQNGFWTYPIIQKQTRGQFVVFLCVCVGVLVVLQLVGRKWSASVWSPRRRDQEIKRSVGAKSE